MSTLKLRFFSSLKDIIIRGERWGRILTIHVSDKKLLIYKELLEMNKQRTEKHGRKAGQRFEQAFQQGANKCAEGSILLISKEIEIKATKRYHYIAM